MVVLISKFTRLSSHHHHRSNSPPHAWHSAAEAFEAHVCHRLCTLFSDAEAAAAALSTGKVSLSWIQRCLEMLPYVNRAFAKLVVSIDHPISSWGADSAEEYLSYTLNLLEHLNRMSSEISHLGHARVSLAHALSVSESASSGLVKRLEGFAAHASRKDFGKVGGSGEDGGRRTGTGKDRVIHKALNLMKGTEFWVSGIVITALSGDASPYLEMKSRAARFLGPSMADDLDKKLHGGIMEKGISLEEVTVIYDSVAVMASNGDGKSRGAEARLLRGRLDAMENSMEGLRKEVDRAFSEVLASRNTLLDCLRAAHCQM